ncbi:hypothetical protein, partial [Bacillus cereus]
MKFTIENVFFKIPTIILQLPIKYLHAISITNIIKLYLWIVTLCVIITWLIIYIDIKIGSVAKFEKTVLVQKILLL